MKYCIEWSRTNITDNQLKYLIWYCTLQSNYSVNICKKVISFNSKAEKGLIEERIEQLNKMWMEQNNIKEDWKIICQVVDK